MAEDGKPTTAPKRSPLPAIILLTAISVFVCIGAAAYFSLQALSPTATQPPPEPASAVLSPAKTSEQRNTSSKLNRLIALNTTSNLGKISLGRPLRNIFAVQWMDILFAGPDLAIPEDTLLQLRVRSNVKDIAPLSTLKPRDLASLDLSRANLDRNSLTPVSHLTGLRFLKLEGPGIDDEALKSLRPLTSLEVLELWSAPITHRGLENLMQMKKLHSVILEGTRVTREELKQLAGLPKLAEVVLSACDTGDQDLSALSSIPRLVVLELIKTRVTDKGLIHLRPLCKLECVMLIDAFVRGPGLDHICTDSLRNLHLEGSLMEDAEIGHLLRMKKLEALFLNRTRITDGALPTIAKLPALRFLNLADTGVTDSGVPTLAKMKKLNQLNLPLNISPAQIENLRRALPQCQVKQSATWPF